MTILHHTWKVWLQGSEVNWSEVLLVLFTSDSLPEDRIDQVFRNRITKSLNSNSLHWDTLVTITLTMFVNQIWIHHHQVLLLLPRIRTRLMGSENVIRTPGRWTIWQYWTSAADWERERLVRKRRKRSRRRRPLSTISNTYHTHTFHSHTNHTKNISYSYLPYYVNTLSRHRPYLHPLS